MPTESLTVNLSGKVRKVVSKGIKYLVAPVRMIVPGVLNGSQGPILYTAEENRASFKKWNGVPLTDTHPPGKAEAFPKMQLGEVRNAGIEESGDLVAEAWFAVTKTKRVNNRIYAALTQGKKIELSTGLGMDKEKPEGEAIHNGTPYNFIARNYEPDHLAILLDEVGACSIQDGCGVNNKSEKGEVESHKSVSNNSKGNSMTPEERKEIVNGLIANNCGCWTKGDEEVLNSFDDDKLKSLKEAQKKNAEKDAVINAATKTFVTNGSEHVFDRETLTWNTKAPEKEEPEKKEGEEVVNKAGQSMTESPQTLDQFMASAPPEVQSVVANAMKVEKRQKESLVRKLIANVAEDQKQAKGDYFMAKSLEELEAIAELIPTTNAQPAPSRIDWSASVGGSETIVNAQKDEFDSSQFLEEVTLNFSGDTSK